MLPRHCALLLGLLPLFAGCQPDKSRKQKASSHHNHEPLAVLGEEASGKLKKTLGGQLKTALQNGGPENALHLCQQVAQPLTSQVSNEQPGVTITRTALRVRNPLNTPDESDREVLEQWSAQLRNGETLPDNVIVETIHGPVFYQPILTEAICLKCHGNPETFSPTLVESLAQFYPNDQATGFQEGDLRGAFRVTR